MRLFAPIALFVVLISVLHCSPPKEIPAELLDGYTMNNTIPVFSLYIDGTDLNSEYLKTLEDGSQIRFYGKDDFDTYIEKVRRRENCYYGPTDSWLYEALEAYPIDNKEVLIIGSTNPWYESVVMAHNGTPVTVDYQEMQTDDDRFFPISVKELHASHKKYDVILSISSIEHDGLGRYGDPLDPNADLAFMNFAKDTLLNPNGFMILSMPVGKDCLYWNAHRIYGPSRLSLLFEKWEILDSFGFSESDFSLKLGDWGHQPVFVLAPKK